LVRIVAARCRRALSRSGLPDLDYALNPYIGCEHGCLYCYGRLYVDPEIGREWGEVVVVRENIVEALRRDVRELRPGIVGVGTISDAYQPIEERYELSRRCIEVLLKSGFRVSVQTKSSLVERDTDILRSSRADVGVTITFIEDSIARRIEPRASPPSERIEVVRRLSRAGVRTWIYLGPVIPGLNDDEETLRFLARLARETNSVLYVDRLRVRRFMYSMRTLAPYARRAESYDWSSYNRLVEGVCREVGVVCRQGFVGDAVERPRRTLDTFFAEGKSGGR